MIRYAAAHEIGHCLGLEHNYRASFAYPTDSLRSESFCRVNGTTPSIMDYARFNYVAQPGDGVVSVYPPLLGTYDIYAIEAGYREFKDDEEYRAFINDHQNDERCLYTKMRISANPTDVSVQPTDLGNDPVASTRYGLRNLVNLPAGVRGQLKQEDIAGFYQQLLGHLKPVINRAKEPSGNAEGTVEMEPSGNAEGTVAEVIDFLNNEVKEIGEVTASTGMWMPHQIVSDEIYSLLKKDGVKLSKKDIYSINKRCASGAVLSLSTDNGVSSPYASASFVSKDGLVLTNFHCVSNNVQRLAKGDNDYMKYGCWSTKREQEAPLFGLELHQLLYIEDITDKVLTSDGAQDSKSVDERARALMDNSQVAYGNTLRVYSLNGGQQYVRACYHTFRDVRIVACPPLWLGALGGDDSNWQWPRYACDFAFLRVYVSPIDGSTDYSKINVPYHPKSWLKVARRPSGKAEGTVAEGDLTMVMGYPGQTRKNIPAFALDKIVNRDTQLRANALKAKIDYLRECSKMATGTALSGYNVRIGKLMNVYLRSKGEIDGVRGNGLVESKRAEDLALQEWINADENRAARYGSNLISEMDSIYSLLTVYNHMDEAFNQIVGTGPGIIPFAGKFEKLITIDRANRKSRMKDLEREVPEVQRNIREFFPSISMKEDCGMMKALLPIYLKAVPKKYLPEILKSRDSKAPISQLVDSLYAISLLTDSLRLEQILANAVAPSDGNGEQDTTLTLNALSTDPLYRMCLDIYTIRVQKQIREATPLRRQNTQLYSLYMQAKADYQKESGMPLSPYEANHTLRLSSGRVKDICYVTDETLDSRYKVSEPTIACFTTSAETVAGNSGSPIINARGELVGLNFDRTLTSTSSIYRYDPFYMRNIAVSIDYILWTIRNISHSQYILEEM